MEEEERALRTMAAYIDLNPVRAGMVEDPADYRWSGYAEAMAGKARSRRGLGRIIGQMAWRQHRESGNFVELVAFEPNTWSRHGGQGPSRIFYAAPLHHRMRGFQTFSKPHPWKSFTLDVAKWVTPP